jgi:cytochrome b561
MQSYGRTAVILHWSVAILIVAVGAVGLMFGNVLHAAKGFWLNLHAIAGVFLLMLAAVRTAWRLTHPAPPLHGAAGATKFIGAATHAAMYALMLAIPIVGLVSFLWHDRIFDFGVVKFSPGIAADKAVYHPTQTLHAWLTYGLIAILALHVTASLWHHFFLRDGLLARMGIGKFRNDHSAMPSA